MRRRLLAPALALVLATSACGGSDGRDPAAATATGGGIPTAPALEGKPFPDAALTRLDSGAPARVADLAGTPAVINLWFSTCQPCKQEMPAFEGVHRALGDKVRFVGLNTGEGKAAAQRFLAEQVAVSYEQWFDPQAEVATGLRIPSFPATLFVSPEGRLLRARYGAMTAEQLQATIAELFG